MAFEHLALPAAIQADDEIAVDGSTDGHRGYSLTVDFGCRFAKACECLMNCQD
jgi:hypothetical protein